MCLASTSFDEHHALVQMQSMNGMLSPVWRDIAAHFELAEWARICGACREMFYLPLTSLNISAAVPHEGVHALCARPAPCMWSSREDQPVLLHAPQPCTRFQQCCPMTSKAGIDMADMSLHFAPWHGLQAWCGRPSAGPRRRGCASSSPKRQRSRRRQ